MRKLKVLGLVVTAVLAVGMFVVSAAFAFESTWLDKGATVSKAILVHSETTSSRVSFADPKGGLFGEEVEVLCNGSGEGTIGPGKAGTLTKFTVVGCETMKGICGEPDVELINTPWTNSIELIGASFYNDLTTTVGTKMVGYNVVCNKIVEDKCEVALARALLENVAGGDVNNLFNSADSNQPKFVCSRSGNGGLLNGIIVAVIGGENLAVSEG
jgi:hypothetical protein